jgi:hypothetical protein
MAISTGVEDKIIVLGLDNFLLSSALISPQNAMFQVVMNCIDNPYSPSYNADKYRIGLKVNVRVQEGRVYESIGCLLFYVWTRLQAGTSCC